MDTENMSENDIQMMTPDSGKSPSKTGISSSPRKRAFRERNRPIAGVEDKVDDTADVHMATPTSAKSPTKRKIASSPRKRAFRDKNTTPDTPVSTKKTDDKPEQAEEAEEEVEQPLAKRHKLYVQRSQDEYPDPFKVHVLWSLDAGCDGEALLLEDKKCVIGTSDGRVISCDYDGQLISQQCFGFPVGALLKHGGRLYTWCHGKKGYEKWKGALVDLSFDPPQTLFEIEDFGNLIIHAEMVDGCLALGDNKGNVALFGCHGEPIWTKEQPLLGDGGFFFADMSGVYVAHKKVVRSYNVTTGEIQWEYTCTGGRRANISRGYQCDDVIFIETNGHVVQLNKSDGKQIEEFVPYRHQASGLCAGNGRLITGNNPTVMFDVTSKKETHRMHMPVKMDQSIAKLHSSGLLFLFWDRLYCVNLTNEGLQRAHSGRYARTFSYNVPTPSDNGSTQLPMTTESDNRHNGVIVKCVTSEDNADDKANKCFVTSEGYEKDWPVMIPRDLRLENEQYIIEKVEPSKLGKFYRVTGDICKYSPEVASIADSGDDTSESTEN